MCLSFSLVLFVLWHARGAHGGQAETDTTTRQGLTPQTEQAEHNDPATMGPSYDEGKKGWYCYEVEPELEKEE